MANEWEVENHNFGQMILIDGQLELKSNTGTIELKSDGTRLNCFIEGWPFPFSPLNLPNGRQFFERFSVQPLHIYFNNSYLGVFKEGKLTNRNYFTFIKIYFSYLKSK